MSSTYSPYIHQNNQTSPHPANFSQRDNDLAEKHESDYWSGNDSGGDGEEKDGSRKRKRPMSVSCELCKQRKVKCDRGQPTCGWCSRNGQLCEYKERKKPGLRAGYGRELESRLDRLETLIQSQANVLSQLTANAIQAARSPPRPDANMFSSLTAYQTPQSIPSETSAPSQISTVYPLPPSGYPEYRGEYGASNNGYHQPAQESFQKQHAPTAPLDSRPFYSNPNVPLERPGLNVTDATGSISMQDHDFPPYDLLYALADLYFKHINTWCPILHRRTTLESLFGPSTLDEVDRILLHAIVATTLRFSTDARLTDEKKEKYHSVSKQKVLLYGLENSSVKALQALVILALDLCGASNGPPGWNLLALITRSSVQLGLAIETTSQAVSPRVPSIYTLRAMVLPESKSWIEEESRRRLFWMVYVLDRYATITTAFEFALDEKEIDRKLPCRDDLYSRNVPVETRWFRHHERLEGSVDRPENLGSFSYYIEIVGILSRIHQFLKKPVDIGALEDVGKWQHEYRGLDSTLNNWKLSLPREYGSMARVSDSSVGNKIVNCGWVMLHATYHTTVIRLHSSAAYPTNRSPIFSPSFSAIQYCLTAVGSISALCSHVKNTAMLDKLGPPFAFSVWVAARVLLIHSSTVDHQINDNIYFFVNILRELGVYWNVADRYASLLQRVLDEFSECERNSAATANGERASTPCPIKIFADTRRCAYDLDFLISRQPRTQTAAGAMGATPCRTPAPNELEYLDVFDFFNMPRLPVNTDGAAAEGGGNGVANQRLGGVPEAHRNIESNITNFMYDANEDWFMKNEQ